MNYMNYANVKGNDEGIAQLATKVTQLKEVLKEKIVDPFDMGDAIRWVSAERYTYVAVKTPVGWYTTSNNYIIPKILDSYEELAEILNRSDVSDIYIATEWTRV